VITIPQQNSKFRRGWDPIERKEWKRVTYVEVPLLHLADAWTRLAECGRKRPSAVLERSRVIAEAMGIDENSATRFRRVLHALRLIENIPGSWSKDADPADNYPAVVIVRGATPESLSERLEGVERVFAANSARIAEGTTRTGLAALAGGGWSRPPTVVLMPGGQFVSRHGTDFPSSIGSYFPSRDTYSVDRTSRDLWSTARSAAPSSCPTPDTQSHTQPHSVPDGYVRVVHPAAVVLVEHAPAPLVRTDDAGLVGIADLMSTFGWSRKTAYRRLKEWTQQGRAARVHRGRYQLSPEVAQMRHLRALP
jgi:hypothetical protein